MARILPVDRSGYLLAGFNRLGGSRLAYAGESQRNRGPFRARLAYSQLALFRTCPHQVAALRLACVSRAGSRNRPFRAGRRADDAPAAMDPSRGSIVVNGNNPVRRVT